MSQSPLISYYFNPVLSWQRTDTLRQPTRRGGAKSKAEPQELCEQRREREISPSSLRSSGLNLHRHPKAHHWTRSCQPERQDPASSTRTQAQVTSTRKPTQPTDPTLPTGSKHQKTMGTTNLHLRKGDPKHS